MTRAEIAWSAGNSSVRAALETALARGLDAAKLLQASAHRSIHQIALPERMVASRGPGSLILKTHHSRTGQHATREWIKSRLGRSPAQREWQALESLFAAGVPVPAPRGWGRRPSGDEIIAMDCLEGESLDARFARASHGERHRIVDAIAHTIRKLHAAGYRHGDLHLGNLWICGERVFLLDLQRSRPWWNARERLRDLAQLEFSLARAGWDESTRSALRSRFECGIDFDAALRRFLRDYLRGRARRVLRVGRNWSPARFGRLRGLRDASLDADTLTTILESSERVPDPVTRRSGRIRMTDATVNGRCVVIKFVAAGGIRRMLGDGLRGSSAARAFRSGQRLGLLHPRAAGASPATGASRTAGAPRAAQPLAAQPLAYLEDRRFGFPLRSWLIVEKVGEQDLDRLECTSTEMENRIASALAVWLAEGHAWGLNHRDYKAGNIRVSLRADSIRFWLIDLEDLAGPAELSEEVRLHALSQLNASLSDDAFGLAARRAALALYVERVPFSKTTANIAKEIARRSLLREHRWQAHGCDSD